MPAFYRRSAVEFAKQAKIRPWLLTNALGHAQAHPELFPALEYGADFIYRNGRWEILSKHFLKKLLI
jgi:hypothetical protein